MDERYRENFPPLSYNPMRIQTRLIDTFRITMEMFSAYLSYLCSRYGEKNSHAYNLKEDPPYLVGEAFLPGRPQVRVVDHTDLPIEMQGERYTYTLTLPVLAQQMGRRASHPREGGFLRFQVHFFLQYDLSRNLIRLDHAEITHESFGFDPPLSLEEVWESFLDRYELLLGHAHPHRNSLILFDPYGVRMAFTCLLDTLQRYTPEKKEPGGASS